MRIPSSCLLLLLASSAACHRDVPSLTLRPAARPGVRPLFQPPEDMLLTETVRSSLRREGAPGSEEAEMTTASRFTSEEGTWRLSQRVTRSRYLQDGQPVTSLVGTLLERVVSRVRLAADGTFVQLEAPGSARETLRELAPRGLDVSGLERFFSPEEWEARTRREWAVTYGGVYGGTLEPGQRGHAVGGLSVGGREVTYLLERTFTGTRPTEFGEVMVFTLHCLAAPGDTSPGSAHEALRRAGQPEVTPGVECDGEQLLGVERFLPVRRGLTLRVSWDGDTWSWATHATLDSVRAPGEEEQRP